MLGNVISLHIRSERLSLMHKHIPVHIPQTVNFGSKFRVPLLSGKDPPPKN